MTAFRIAACVLLLSGVAAAQTVIDPNDYMPLGALNKWLMTEQSDSTDQLVIAIKNVTVSKGVRQYNTAIPRIDDLKDVRFLWGFEGGSLFLYAAKVTDGIIDDDIKIERVSFSQPILVAGASTTLDGAPVTTVVNETIKASGEVGPKKVTVDVKVTGTISASWQSVFFDVTTPLKTFPAADLVQLQVAFDLEFKGKGDLDFTEDVDDSAFMILAKNAGFVQVVGGNRLYQVKAAILPGGVLGNFPPLPADITDMQFPASGLLTLQDAIGPGATDGTVTLSGLEMTQTLAGAVTVTGNVTVSGAVPPKLADGEVRLTGKMKLDGLGGGSVKLKGKSTHPAVKGKLTMWAKEPITKATTSFTLAYKGKDLTGVPIAGTLSVPLTPGSADSVTIALNGMADTKFEQSEKKRPLGSEGTLTIGNVDFPVVLTETLKMAEGKPDKRGYALAEIGFSKSVAKLGATSTNAADYAVTKFKAKIAGLKVVLGSLAELVLTVK